MSCIAFCLQGCPYLIDLRVFHKASFSLLKKTCLTINWVNTSRDNDNSNREHLPEASWCLLRLDLAPLSDNLVLRIGLWVLRAMHKVTFALVVSLN